MDITVYLPDDLGKRARNATPPLPFSRLLRQAVIEELKKRERAFLNLDRDYRHCMKSGGAAREFTEAEKQAWIDRGLV